MRHFSKKRQKQNREYSKLRVAYLEANPMCEALVSEDCQALAGELHHRFGRIGKNLVDLSGFVAVCRPCHLFLERNPLRAKELGLSESRLAK